MTSKVEFGVNLSKFVLQCFQLSLLFSYHYFSAITTFQLSLLFMICGLKTTKIGQKIGRENADTLALTETKLHTAFPNGQFLIPGYPGNRR